MMSNSLPLSTCALSPRIAAWCSLVRQSIDGWISFPRLDSKNKSYIKAVLENECPTLGAFLGRPRELMHVWFFQHRLAFMSQKRLTKWSPDNSDNYILLPGGYGCIWRDHCFFVSHFWQTRDDPDPDGRCLRLHQRELAQQKWFFIWVDWTCLPQSPRSVVDGVEVHKYKGTFTHQREHVYVQALPALIEHTSSTRRLIHKREAVCCIRYSIGVIIHLAGL
jgi:hypothetical protein